jgi:hypothetical protein
VAIALPTQRTISETREDAMRIQIRSPQDFWAGMIFMALALFFLLNGLQLALGTSVRMGPGYAPRLLSGLLLAIGAALVVRGVAIHSPDTDSLHFRPMIFVLGSMLIFAFALERLGLALTTLLVVAASSLSVKGARPLEVLIIGVLAAAAASGIFIYALKLTIPLWPSI